jgi:predicted NBD/HSP70 family sugar kinase
MAARAAGTIALNAKTARSLELTVPGERAAAAVDHGGTNPRVGFFDAGGRPVLRTGRGEVLAQGVRLEMPSHDRLPAGCPDPKELPAWTAAYLAEVLGPLLKRWGVRRLGYSIAGPVSRDGVAVKTPQIWGPTVRNVRYRRMLEKALDLPGGVVLGNDMWAAANDIMARGARQKPPFEVRDFVVITVSSGIGSKVVVDGEVQLGVEGLAVEIGHLPILYPDEIIPGRRCGCGGLYCLEAGASGNANAYRAKAAADRLLPLASALPSSRLIREIAAISLDPGEDLDQRAREVNVAVVKAALRDDPLASSIVEQTVRPIARAVASLESQLNIRNFYFVGGFALALGERFLTVLREHLLSMGIIGRSPETIVKIGRLYNVRAQDWGLRGAALAAHRRVRDGERPASAA